MLRSYNLHSNKQFAFGCVVSDQSKIKNQDTKILNRIETEINNLTSRLKLLQQGYLDTTHLNFVINRHLSQIVKKTLNQYDIGHFEKTKWCGLRKYTIITFDKIIPRIISKTPKDISKPLEQLVSNAININIQNTNNGQINNTNNTYRHDYLNPENKAHARRLRGIYNA
jgi:hypothetical protein